MSEGQLKLWTFVVHINFAFPFYSDYEIETIFPPKRKTNIVGKMSTADDVYWDFWSLKK